MATAARAVSHERCDARASREVRRGSSSGDLGEGGQGLRAIGAADGSFVIPFKEFRELATAAKGDAAIIEQKLGLDAGTLSKGGARLFKIEPGALDNLRMATGRETGANGWWIPGGYTSGGMSEAVIDFPPGLKATELHLKVN